MSESSLSRTILRRLKTGKGRIGALAFLMAVGLLLWGRLLLLKPLPRVATADPAAVARQLAQKQKQGSQAVAKPAANNTVYVDLPSRLNRDLFKVDSETYGTLFAPQVKIIQPSPDGEKSPPQEADVTQQVQSAAKGLALRAVIMGDQPRAVINGRTMAVGEEINGLTLVQVNPRSVVLRMNGIDVRLDQ